MKTKVLQNAPDRATGAGSIIRTVGLGKRYGDIDALAALDLDVPRHAVVGFLGPNGAGKTTAIRLLLGLARPTTGSATVFGLDSVRDSLAIRARIGYLAQDPRFYRHLTARQTLRFAARFFYRGTGPGLTARIDEMLDLVGLRDRADRPVHGFSGGERQRLGIAQAQINHPDLLILDEPAASLDPGGRRDVLDIMMRLRSRTTVFYSTHILDDVQRVSDRIAILDRGRLVANAATADLLDGDAVTYEIELRGDGVVAAQALRTCSGVRDVVRADRQGVTTLTVRVRDRAAADALLPAVLAGGAVVTAFGRRRSSLEDVFLALVKGEER